MHIEVLYSINNTNQVKTSTSWKTEMDFQPTEASVNIRSRSNWDQRDVILKKIKLYFAVQTSSSLSISSTSRWERAPRRACT